MGRLGDGGPMDKLTAWGCKTAVCSTILFGAKMKSLREFSSAVMQKHLLRAKLRQLVNKARVFGRTPDNVGEIKKGWGQYDAMKARAFAAQVFALRELAARSERVVSGERVNVLTKF